MRYHAVSLLFAASAHRRGAVASAPIGDNPRSSSPRRVGRRGGPSRLALPDGGQRAATYLRESMNRVDAVRQLDKDDRPAPSRRRGDACRAMRANPPGIAAPTAETLTATGVATWKPANSAGQRPVDAAGSAPVQHVRRPEPTRRSPDGQAMTSSVPNRTEEVAAQRGESDDASPGRAGASLRVANALDDGRACTATRPRS